MPRLALLWLLGVDLRLSLLAIPPILPLIHRDLDLSAKAVGLLSGLPILLLGAAALVGSLLIARLGPRRACVIALVLLALVSAARGIGPSTFVLFAATILTGLSIAILQPTLPSLVAAWFPTRPGFATAVYTNGLLIGEALPAALTLPLVLPLVGGSWEASLAVWAIPIAVSAGLVLLAPAAASPTPGVRGRWWPDWRDGRIWQLGLLLAGVGGLYFSTNAFVPDYLHSIGREDLVTASLTALNTGQLPASLIILVFSRRLVGRRWPLLAAPVIGIVGLAGVLSANAVLHVAGAAVVGFGAAVILILVLALPPVLAPPDQVHRLSAGAFTIGYPLSCLVPTIGGAAWDLTGMPATAFLSGALAAGMVFVIALRMRAEMRPA